MSDEFLKQLICLLRDDDEEIARHSLKDIIRYDQCELEYYKEVFPILEEALDYVAESVLPDLITVVLGFADGLKINFQALCLKLLENKRSAVRHCFLQKYGYDFLHSEPPLFSKLLSLEKTPAVLASMLSFIDSYISSKEVGDVVLVNLSHIDSRVRANAVEAMDRLSMELNDEQVDLLLNDPSPRVKANVIKLQWHNNRQRMEKIVISELESKDVKRQRCALYLLGVLSPFTDVVKILTAELANEDCAKRALAVKGLSKLDVPLDYQSLVIAFLNEKESHIEESIKAIFSNLANGDGILQVFDSLFDVVINNGEDSTLRIKAAAAFSGIGGPFALDYIKRCLKIDSSVVKVAVIEGISSFDGSDDVISILEELKTSENDKVSSAATFELCSTISPPSQEDLLPLVQSSDLAVLRRGATALLKCGTRDSLSVLVDSYKRINKQVIIGDDEREVSDLLLLAIENIKRREEMQ